MVLSTKDQAARQAFLARQRIMRLLSTCEGKLEALDRLLHEHQGEQSLFSPSPTLQPISSHDGIWFPPLPTNVKQRNESIYLKNFMKKDRIT